MNSNHEYHKDSIVAEIRLIRDTYARQFDYDPHRIVEDLRAKRHSWEAMGIEFVDINKHTSNTGSLSEDDTPDHTDSAPSKSKETI